MQEPNSRTERGVILVGSGGHCASVIDSIETQGIYHVFGIADGPSKLGGSVLGHSISFVDAELTRLFSEGVRFSFLAIGGLSPESAKKRIILDEMLTEIGYTFPKIIDPSARVSRHSTIDDGVFIAKGCCVNVRSSIGRQVVLNTACSIDHDCTVEAFAFISPGVVLAGGVTVGGASFIGAGATVIQGVTIGKNSLVGAGSVVVRDIPANVVAFGNPCRVQRSL